MRPELIPFATLQRQRWQNNGGWTREVARGGGTCWDWRVSVADVETDGPFSLFPGIARELRILSGAGVALDFADGRRHILTPQQPRLRFDGESAITSRLLAGPVRDFNLMWRRDLLNAKLTEAEWQGSHTLRGAANALKISSLAAPQVLSKCPPSINVNRLPETLLPSRNRFSGVGGV